ncbi:MAG: FliI/YscN family ATPase [Magnetococcales bacterium]|nr:FliI/YscN family ATPase [Magnetococcales bacterium]
MNHDWRIPWDELRQAGLEAIGYRRFGHVDEVAGLMIESTGPAVAIGELCEIHSGGEPVLAEVVGFRGRTVLLMPMGSISGVRPGSLIISRGQAERVAVGEGLLGRVVDALGRPMDHLAAPRLSEHAPLHAAPINPMKRRRIDTPLDLGIRAVNGLLTVGKGQRMGIFAGSGVGKSTLLGMMARYTAADVNVIGLIGERGREVVEFLERELGPQGIARSVVVVATSDQPPVFRLRAAFLATAIAEHFRGQGKDVLLMMDSITRFAMAQREVGLARGEPPTSKGYPPSIFMMLPRLLERAGRDDGPGSITGLYTVLMEGDDLQDPIVDTARGILDGHILLSRDLADRGHYPAIDVLGSISRLMEELAADPHKKAARRMREMLAVYRRAEDMINIGAYAKGSNPRIDQAIKLIDPINGYLQQAIGDNLSLDESVRQLSGLFPG